MSALGLRKAPRMVPAGIYKVASSIRTGALIRAKIRETEDLLEATRLLQRTSPVGEARVARTLAGVPQQLLEARDRGMKTESRYNAACAAVNMARVAFAVRSKNDLLLKQAWREYLDWSAKAVARFQRSASRGSF